MARKTEDRTLTRSEMEIMNILWDSTDGMTTHEIISRYPDPKPAYSTIATFLKILTTKGFVNFRKVEGSKTHIFFALISREFYTRNFMKEAKNTLFGGSLKSLISFFIKEEEISDDELQEILAMIGPTPNCSEDEEPAAHSNNSYNHNHPSLGGEGGGLL